MKTISSVIISTSALAATSVELMILHDTSNTALDDIASTTHLQSIVEQLQAEYSEVKVAVSDFSDKPNVHVGVGTYGGWPGPYLEDWCYKLERSLTNNLSAIQYALQNLHRGSGRDVLEGNFEALVNAAVDSKVGWSDDATKVIVMVTDAMGHSQALNTLAEHVVKFNTPVRCVGGEKLTAGGIGAYDTADRIENWLLPELLEGYDHFADLIYHKTCVGDLTDEQLAEVEELKVTYGPLRVPSVKKFDLDVLKSDSAEHCRYHEYPAYSDIVAVMEGFKLQVILYEPTPKQKDAWEWVLTDTAVALGSLPNKLTYLTSEEGFEKEVLTDLKTLIDA